ncbi:hypothetical protein DPMN_058942 [Dreissena polymorpha]|uniref:Uncharacterized protein n=1 Tax=Dreissena polymorpha TaxID=45954 RepID=A0A9D4HG29_DREPO|nr:hypothetical protein DPMN_058942 [Dreissena polymorpha]
MPKARNYSQTKTKIDNLTFIETCRPRLEYDIVSKGKNIIVKVWSLCLQVIYSSTRLANRGLVELLESTFAGVSKHLNGWEDIPTE